MKDNKKYERAEDAALDAIIKLCENYPTELGTPRESEMLRACCEVIRMTLEVRRAL